MKQTRPAASRTYKNTLFRMIFREKQNILQLYNALNGTNYTDVDDLEVVTLENTIMEAVQVSIFEYDEEKEIRLMWQMEALKIPAEEQEEYAATIQKL